MERTGSSLLEPEEHKRSPLARVRGRRKRRSFDSRKQTQASRSALFGRIGACRADLGHWDAIDPPGAAFVFCRESSDPAHAFHARMFAPPMGVPEDPATGSAAAAFAGVLSQFACPSDGEHAYVIEQGYEMGRPSVIHLEMQIDGGELATASIAGDAVIVTEGTLHT